MYHVPISGGGPKSDQNNDHKYWYTGRCALHWQVWQNILAQIKGAPKSKGANVSGPATGFQSVHEFSPKLWPMKDTLHFLKSWLVYILIAKDELVLLINSY